MFISTEWQHDNKNVGETFVFSLKPHSERYLAVLGEDERQGTAERKEEDVPKILMTVSPTMLALGAAQGCNTQEGREG